MAWKMGNAEGYYNAFYRWFSALDEKERTAFMRENPEPADWSGFYHTAIEHPWV